MRICWERGSKFAIHQQSASKLWGNSFLAKRTAIGLVKIGIVATVTVGGMDATVEPSGKLILKTVGVSLE